MKKTFGKLALAALLSTIPFSTGFAYTIDYFSSPAGDGSILTTPISWATVYDFNDGFPAALTLENGGGVVTANPTLHAAPAGDETKFFSVPADNNAGTATITFSTPYNYLGFYWGSIDDYNIITFRLGTDTLFTIAGDGLPDPTIANGNQFLEESNRYVNFYTGSEFFDNIVMTSNTRAFEIDNLAVATVPEPTTMLLFGTGLLGLAAAARRRKNS